jgi:hypothetical protein
MRQVWAHQCSHRIAAHWSGYAQKRKLIFHISPHGPDPLWAGQGLQGHLQMGGEQRHGWGVRQVLSLR